MKWNKINWNEIKNKIYSDFLMLLYLMWSTFYCWSKSYLKISLYIKGLSGHLLVKVGVNVKYLFPMNALFGEAS